MITVLSLDTPGKNNRFSICRVFILGLSIILATGCSSDEPVRQGPTVSTSAVSDFTDITAIGGGNVTADGGSEVTARGVCWSTGTTPTISDSKTADGNGTGIFASSITGLAANTTYFVRAYSTSEAGTAYGNVESFTTQPAFEPFTAVAISAGWKHSLALRADGTLWAWGSNEYGQLGDGTNVDKAAPVQIGSGYAVIAAGGAHSLGIKTDGTLWEWGDNNTTPEQVGSGFGTIAAGRDHSLALRTDGVLWTWGNNAYGQLGDGTFVVKAKPAELEPGYVAIGAGDGLSFAVKTDGSLWAWGGDEFDIKTKPVQIDVGYSKVAVGWYRAFALKTDGSL